MKKNKFIGLLIIVLGLFFSVESRLISVNAFTFTTVCQSPMTTFSDGNPTFDISFPPGGGTTCDTIADCPTSKLSDNATIFSIKVDMELTNPDSEIGTPYLWVPISVANGYIAQIDMRDGFETEIARYKVGKNPSRTFVIPGGDVWVANRDSGNVTKLSPLMGNQPAGGTCGDGFCGTDETIYFCPTDCNGNICGDGTGTCKNNIACGIGVEDCKEYKVVDHYPTGNGPRGVTGDINGFVWVANNGSANIVRIDPNTGTILDVVATGGTPYGLIADQFGYVWVSNSGAGTVQAVDIASGAITQTIAIAGNPYGIGIDADGNVLVASCTGATATKINGYGTGVPGTIAWTVPLAGGASTRGRGIASDLNGNVWVGSDNGAVGTVYSFTPNGAQYCPPYNPAPQHNTVGVAVDFNNNIWAVPYDGSVLKFKPDNIAACTLVVPIVTVFVPGGLLYNYSDMTGLRTVPKTITIGSSGTSIPLSATGTFEICSDPLAPPLCSDSSDCDSLFLPTSCGSPSGFCEIPLEIFSMQAGDYTLTNLEVVYGKQVPVTTGGLVPCGREWNDPATSWNDTDPCTLCYLIPLADNIIKFLLKIVGMLAILFIVIGGIMYVSSAGNSSSVTMAKLAITKSVFGFTIVLIAWVIINVIMTLFGFSDPLGDGSWEIFSCTF